MLHVVLFRPKPGLTMANRREVANALHAALTAIPTVRRARIGKRVTHGARYEARMPEDLEFAALLWFDDLAGLQSYLTHPAHDRLGATFTESIAVGLMYDYELRDPSEIGEWLDLGSG
jgi:hypothetical protein